MTTHSAIAGAKFDGSQPTETFSQVSYSRLSKIEHSRFNVLMPQEPAHVFERDSASSQVRSEAPAKDVRRNSAGETCGRSVKHAQKNLDARVIQGSVIILPSRHGGK